VKGVEEGELDWIGEPPADRYLELKRKYEGTQFRSEPDLSIYCFWMNTSKPPFDDLARGWRRRSASPPRPGPSCGRSRSSAGRSASSTGRSRRSATPRP
jgi:hypothetical protein